MAKAKTKQDLLKAHLLKYKSITSWEAIQKFAATRLAAMIFLLEKHGWKFERKTVRRKEGETEANYTRYTLISSPKSELKKIK